MVADTPGVRENDLPPVVALSAGELWLRLYWVNGRGAETIVKVSGAKLVFSSIQIAIDREIMLVGEVRRCSRKLANVDRLRCAVDRDIGRPGLCRGRRKLLQDSQHGRVRVQRQ